MRVSMQNIDTVPIKDVKPGQVFSQKGVNGFYLRIETQHSGSFPTMRIYGARIDDGLVIGWEGDELVKVHDAECNVIV